MTNPTLIEAKLKFEYLKEIGQEGKNSKVYISLDKQLNCEIVVKEIPKANFTDEIDYFSEAQKLSMSSHPNIVDIKFACQDDTFVYFSMPFYKNGSLKSILSKRFLTVREILRYSIQFLSALHHIHTKGLVHFDIKPDNILISNSNEALLSDFGLARATNSLGLAEMGLAYDIVRPPDSFIQLEHTKKYDIYQAGLLIYRMCSGENDFYAQFNQLVSSDETYEKAIVGGLFPNRKSFFPHIPKKLKKVISKMLEIKQDDRYVSILDVLNDLSNINEYLDWQLSYSEIGIILTKTNQKHEINVYIEEKDNILKIETFRTNIETQKKSIVNDCTKKDILGTKFDKEIIDILNKLD